MAPFVYQPWHNEYVNSISQLMERQGQIPAQAAERAAAAQAQARLTSGQAWAGAAQNVGQAVTGAIQQATDPRRKMEAAQATLAQGQVADANRMRAGQGQVDQMMSAAPLPAGQAGPQQESYLTPEGLFDIPKMNAALAKSGSAHMAPELLTGAERINAAIQKSQEHDQIAAQQKTLLYGDLADGVLKLTKTGMPITAAMDFVIAPALATKRLQPQEYDQIKQQIGAMPPEQQTAALTSLMDAAEKLDKGDTLSEGAIHVGRYGRTESKNPRVDKPKTKAELASDAANSASPTSAQSAAALKMLDSPKAPTEASLDARQQELLGKQAQGISLSPAESAEVKAYQERKRTVSDPAQLAASERQAASQAQQNTIQQRGQDFAQQQAGRRELTEKVEAPFQTAVAQANTLRHVVQAAKDGNKVAAALQNLETTFAAVRAAGLNRVNMAEIHQTGTAGSFMDNLESRFGKLTEGQPVPADLQKDMLSFADILEKAAADKYREGFSAVTTRYGLKDEKPLTGRNKQYNPLTGKVE